MGRMTKLVLGGFAGLLVLAQAVRFEQTNPPVTGEVPAPPEVLGLLKRACWDCHSNETKWPWYTQVAPSSWLAHRDVVEGRKELNFSEWGTYSEQRRAKKLKEIAEEVGEGEMPLFFYVPLHPEAKLSQAERDTLVAWAKAPAPVPAPVPVQE